MPAITFISHDGNRKIVEAELDYSVAEAAVNKNIAGVTMECGGGGACAGCHVLIDRSYLEHLPPADEDEADMLQFTENTKSNSRLACQLMMTPELEGMIVHTLEVSC
ncbi:MAG: 2Fe-2S iron-sulfur cluster-binding protein [Pseudomonadales bacterium]